MNRQKEYEEIYFWIDKVISTSNTSAQLDACEALIRYFEHRKFKKDIPTKKQINDYVNELNDRISKRKGVLRKRLYDEKKNNGN